MSNNMVTIVFKNQKLQVLKDHMVIMDLMYVYLDGVGNPDFKQNPNVHISPQHLIRCDSFEEASRICQRYISDWNLGGGNWAGGHVFKDGHQIAKVSYNGRIWDKDGNEIT